VVGPNGAGKSTVLKIMAGLDQPSNGEAFLTARGYTSGILLQEPPLNEEKTVLGKRRGGVGEIKGSSTGSTRSPSSWPPTTPTLMEEMGKLQEELDHADAWDLDSQLEQAMDALRCPPPDAGHHLSGGERRRVALCKLLLSQARPAAARRAHQPPGRRERAVAGAAPGELPGHRPGRHARPVLPRQRRRVDPGAGPRARLRYQGNYSTYLEKKRRAPGGPGRKDAKLAKRSRKELEWVRSNPRRARPSRGRRLERYEEMAAEAEKTRKLDFEEIQIPPGPRLGNVVVEVENLTKGFGDRLLIDDLSFTLPRNGIVGVIGPNGVGKTTLFKTIVGLEKPDSGTVQDR
jgi:ATPase subunit of ABC transporter with duplicated ATPase domains